MKKALLVITSFLSLAVLCSFEPKSNEVTIKDLGLNLEELPEGYIISDKDLAKSVQPTLLFKEYSMYATLLPEVEAKEFQSFKSKKDEGTVYYFQYKTPEDANKTKTFLKGLIWGGEAPNDKHPEEIKIIGKFLFIWSFDRKSKIKDISINKVQKVLDSK